jgi:hypothetical protein
MPMVEEHIARCAIIAVEEKLKLATLFFIHEEDFLETLVEAHERARESLSNGDRVFFGEVIPLMASCIQVFVKQSDFFSAIEWAKEEFRGIAKPVGILPVLTITYLIERGWKRSLVESELSQNTWRELRKRLDSLPVD